MFGRAMMPAGWHVAADHLADRLGPLHLKERLRLSHDRGPPQTADYKDL
jgi:hypothetical protein